MIAKAGSSLALLAFLVGAAATAQSPGAPRTTPRDDGNRRVCRTYHDTGTRLGSYRACHTMAEWAELRRQTIQIIDHIQNSRAGDAQ